MVTADCRFIQKQVKLRYRYILEKTINRFLQTSQIELQKKILVYYRQSYLPLAVPHIGTLYKIGICDNNEFNQKVTLNNIIKDKEEGTSETTRDITKFNFESYSKVKPSHKIIDKRFLEWFIGFTEGDGSFISYNGKPVFDITQNLTDIQILKYIRTTLGFGKIIIRDEPHRNVGVFYVTGKDNFIRQIKIFNGNIRSIYKQNQFEQWVKNYNLYYNEDIQIKKNSTFLSQRDSWLSGFIDAEGCFETRYRICKTSKLKERPRQIFSISQKQEEIQIKIRNIIQQGDDSNASRAPDARNVNYDKSWDGYRQKTENRKDQITLMNYIQAHKQKTKKKMDYHKWRNIQNQMRKGNHYTEEGNKTIKKMLKITKIAK